MFQTQRRSLILAAGAACLGSAVRAQTAGYPSRPLSLVVPYPAGGPSDVSARIYAEVIGRDLKQPVIVENIGGGTGVIGANKVLNAPADGYTFFHGSANEVILAPLLNPAAKYKPTDFKYAQPLSESAIVVLTRTGLEAGTLDELIELGRKSKQRALTYATVGIDSLYHVMGDAMAKRTGANFLHVPYKGSAPAVQDLASGQVDFAILPYQMMMDGMAQQGRLKLLTSFSRVAPPALKHIPTIGASKLLPDFEQTISGGHLVRRDTPNEITERLRAAIRYALQQPDLRAKVESEGRKIAEPAKSQAEADAFMSAEIERYSRLLKDAGRELRAI